MFQGEHRHRPDTASDALDADALAFQVWCTADVRRGNKITVGLVDETREKRDIETARRGTDNRTGNR